MRWLKRLLNPHEELLQQITENTDKAEKNLEKIIATLDGEDQWMVRDAMRRARECKWTPRKSEG